MIIVLDYERTVETKIMRAILVRWKTPSQSFHYSEHLGAIGALAAIHRCKRGRAINQ